MGGRVIRLDFDPRLPDGEDTAYNATTVAYPPLVAFTGLYIVGLLFRTSAGVASPPKQRVR